MSLEDFVSSEYTEVVWLAGVQYKADTSQTSRTVSNDVRGTLDCP